jgi:protein phosphatase
MSDLSSPPPIEVVELALPELALVALVGISGAGKSDFARRHFKPTAVLSSDYFRGLVADDENDQAASPAAFDALYYVASKRLAGGHLTVIDATNVQPEARRGLVKVARDHDVLPVAIVLDLPLRTCLERNRGRPERNFGEHVLRHQADQLRRSLRLLDREGFRRVHVLRSVEEIEAAVISYRPLLNDLRSETGPFDVIGDVHGCREELEELLTRLGYELARDSAGRPVGAVHPEGRRVIFLGDLVDRGPDTPGVMRLAMGMIQQENALAVAGNHEVRLVRALRGRKIGATHGLAETLRQLQDEGPEFSRQVADFCHGLLAHYVLDGGRLVVAHAGLKEAYQGRASSRVRDFSLYGDTTGETDEFGLPVRFPWASEYRGSAMVLYGHVPVAQPVWLNNTLCLDTGCVFGGQLSALRYPEKEVISVAAQKVWYQPVRPLMAPAPGGAAPVAAGSLLEIGDVLGHRVIDTGWVKGIAVRAENAAAALEVMSRFALAPNWLLYLPPTMAPAPSASQADLLEHPQEAFSAYHREGVDQLICEEKHMGSRAVAVVCRDPEVARWRFGGIGSERGALYTRTGRPCFDPELTGALLDRIGSAVGRAGLWAELSTDWLVLDCELMPWSVKAEGLLRQQYAPVGAAARAGLTAAISELEAARALGLDVGRLLARTVVRQRAASSFTATYRRYCWNTAGMSGLQLAPFQLLASEGAVHYNRDQLCHLEIAKRLAEADPELIVPNQTSRGGRRRSGFGRGSSQMVGEPHRLRRRGHGGQAAGQPGRGSARGGSAGPQGPGS